MTETEKAISKFTEGIGGSRFREIFDLLGSHGLRPLGKSNTATLLFQYPGPKGQTFDVLAFRLGQRPVLSFPKSYWLKHKAKLGSILADFSYSEQPPVTGPVSETQFSAAQIELSKNTHSRVMAVCCLVCAELTSNSS